MAGRSKTDFCPRPYRVRWLFGGHFSYVIDSSPTNGQVMPGTISGVTVVAHSDMPSGSSCIIGGSGDDVFDAISCQFPSRALGSAATSAQMVVAVLGLLCIVEGLRSLKNSPAQSSGLYPAIWVFLLVQPSYPYDVDLYGCPFLYPCIPFALLIGMKGSRRLWHVRLPGDFRWRFWDLRFLLTYSAQGYWAIQKTRHPSSENQMPLGNPGMDPAASAGGDHASHSAARGYPLITDRFGIAGGPSRDAEDFRRRLVAVRIPYVLFTPIDTLTLNAPQASRSDSGVGRADEVAVSWPCVFEKLYENPEEGTRLYRIRAKQFVPTRPPRALPRVPSRMRFETTIKVKILRAWRA